MIRLRHFVYLALMLVLAFCRAHAADIYDCYNGSSEQGGNRITVNGIQSNQYVQQSYPGTTVTVYLHNTVTLATIFSDGAGTLPLSNPFSSSAHGVAFVCAADGRYDFKYSGTTITVPYTVSDIKFCFACSGGGGGAVGPGTVNQIAKFVTTTNVGNSTGFDDGASLVQWPNGLTSMGSAYGHLYPNSTNGTVANKLACIDATATLVAQVTTCPTSTTKAVGVVHVGTAGTTGNAQVTTLGFDACVFDNQTIVGDYVGPSTTVAGDCSDIGGTRPAAVQGIGRVTTLNTGVGTTAIIDLGPWDLFAPGSSGAGQCSSNNANAYFTGGNLVCDALVTDDGSGNLTAKSIGLTDATQAGFFYLKQGAQPVANPANTRMDTLPASVTTHTVIHPNGPGSIGQTEVVNTTGVDSNGNTILNMKWGTAGGVANPQIGTPVAPTVTPKGTPGATNYSYLVFGCQDGSPCSITTSQSSVGSTSTGNASLSSSNFNQLTGYGDTLYGPTGYSVCRTVGGATQGLIATNVGKQFSDTGLTASGACPASTNTTALSALGLVTPGIGCNALPLDLGHGVDAQPCTVNAFDEEFGNTFGVLGDVNNPPWIQPYAFDANTTATLTGGMLSIASTGGTGATHIQCLMKPVPGSTPWTFEDVHFLQQSVNSDGWGGMGLYEQSTGKLVTIMCAMDSGANPQELVYSHWTSITAHSNPTLGASTTCQAIGNFKMQDDGTNIVTFMSNDGATFVQQTTELITGGFTTAPSHYGLCIAVNAAAPRQFRADFGYLRRTQ